MNLNVVVGVVVVVVVVVATATAAVLLLVAFVVPAARIFFVFVFVAAAAAAVDVATFIFRKVYYVQNFSTFWWICFLGADIERGLPDNTRPLHAAAYAGSESVAIKKLKNI